MKFFFAKWNLLDNTYMNDLAVILIMSTAACPRDVNRLVNHTRHSFESKRIREDLYI